MLWEHMSFVGFSKNSVNRSASDVYADFGQVRSGQQCADEIVILSYANLFTYPISINIVVCVAAA